MGIQMGTGDMHAIMKIVSVLRDIPPANSPIGMASADPSAAAVAMRVVCVTTLIFASVSGKRPRLARPWRTRDVMIV
jgi:hypothetical protein